MSWRELIFDAQSPGRKTLRRRNQRVKFHGPIIILGDLKSISIGPDSSIRNNVELHGGGYPWCKNVGSIKIGPCATISGKTVIWGAGPGGVNIGSHFDCGPNVSILSSTSFWKGKELHHSFAPVVIGDYVTIYTNATILPGVSIGNNARIGAGAVVTKNVAEGQTVVGVPAKPIERSNDLDHV